MTASEFAEKTGVPYQTVVRWIRNKVIPDVQITEFGKFKVYMIPAEAVETFARPKIGRPKKAGETGKGSELEDGGSQALLFDAEDQEQKTTRTKPTKNAASSRPQGKQKSSQKARKSPKKRGGAK